jgi:hypothetical protein
MQARGKVAIFSLLKMRSYIVIDALLGLRELFDDYPDIITPSLTPLLNGCVRLIADEVNYFFLLCVCD